MKAQIYITLKPGLLDVQGKTIKSALEKLEFKGVQDVRVGKYIEIDLGKRSATAAKKDVDAMCQKLLINPVIEISHVEMVDEKPATRAQKVKKTARKRKQVTA